MNELPGGQDEERGDDQRGHSLRLAVPVGVVLVGRLGSQVDPYQADHVGGRVKDRVETVGDQAQGARPVANDQLGSGGQ